MAVDGCSSFLFNDVYLIYFMGKLNLISGLGMYCNKTDEKDVYEKIEAEIMMIPKVQKEISAELKEQTKVGNVNLLAIMIVRKIANSFLIRKILNFVETKSAMEMRTLGIVRIANRWYYLIVKN
jgi:hypothetical protein